MWVKTQKGNAIFVQSITIEPLDPYNAGGKHYLKGNGEHNLGSFDSAERARRELDSFLFALGGSSRVYEVKQN
jgi:hypothetical protein